MRRELPVRVCVCICAHTRVPWEPRSQVLESNLCSSPSPATKGCGPLSKRVNLSASVSEMQSFPSFSTHLLCPAEGQALDRGDPWHGWVADQGRWGPGLGFPQLPPEGKSPWFSRLLGNGPGTPLRKREGVFQSWRHQKCPLHEAGMSCFSGLLQGSLGRVSPQPGPQGLSCTARAAGLSP